MGSATDEALALSFGLSVIGAGVSLEVIQVAEERLIGNIIFVDDHNETGPWDGTTIATAFQRVPDGLAMARLDDWVWVFGDEVKKGEDSTMMEGAIGG